MEHAEGNRRVRVNVASPVAAPLEPGAAHPVSTDVVVRRAVEMLSRQQKMVTGRLLAIEPYSPQQSQQLRALGFRGELWALTRETAAPWMPSAYDVCQVRDWLGMLAQPQPRDPTLADMHQFDLVIASHVAALTPMEHLGVLGRWLAGLLVPRGFLILREPSPPFELRRYEHSLAEAGLHVSADELRETGETPHVIAVLHHRGEVECRQSGVLHRLIYDDVRDDALLEQSLIATYRDVFAGEEWQEWLRCVSPTCGRQYSRLAAEQLPTPAHCECGWAEPMEPYHLPETVQREIQHELGELDPSCCYTRRAADGTVDAFIWGYVTTPQALAHALISSEHPAGGRSFQERLEALIATAPRAGGHNPPAEIYYQSKIGVLEGMRNLSLVRAMFQRVLEFAADQGQNVIVTRTLPNTAAYPLLLGLGMQVLYRYDMPDGDEMPGGADVRSDDMMQDGTPEETSMAAPRTDRRMLLGGSIQDILKLIATESDRRMALHIAHTLRRQKQPQTVASHA